MNQLSVFKYQDAAVRTVTDDQGEPWFVVKDVCEYFGDSDHKRSASRLDEDEKRLVDVTDALGRMQQATAVSEAGLYALLFSFQPEKARGDGGAQLDTHISDRLEKIKAFKRWITHEVLPSIRKHGLYATPATVERMLADPDTMIQALTALKEERIKRAILEEERKALLPKAEQFDQFLDGSNYKTVGVVAKELGMGRTRLFSFLREKGVLMGNNVPYQRHLSEGHFVVKEKPLTMGEANINYSQTFVTAKGVSYIAKLLKAA